MPGDTKKPKTFQEWRALWHGCHSFIGQCVEFQFRQHGQIKMTREIYAEMRRADRIHKWLDAECDAMTSSYTRAILDMIFNKKS